ncbi:MAG: CapA family protein [Dehalobacterium sp.]
MSINLKKIYKLFAILMVFSLIAGCGAEPAEKEPSVEAVEVPEVIIPEISLMAVGDVMLARKLDRLISQKGMEYPFLMSGELLSATDITFTNLESPLSDQGAKIDGKGIWFRGNPENTQALLHAALSAWQTIMLWIMILRHSYKR